MLTTRGWSALHYAVSGGHTEIATTLVRAGAPAEETRGGVSLEALNATAAAAVAALVKEMSASIGGGGDDDEDGASSRTTPRRCERAERCIVLLMIFYLFFSFGTLTDHSHSIPPDSPAPSRITQKVSGVERTSWHAASHRRGLLHPQLMEVHILRASAKAYACHSNADTLRHRPSCAEPLSNRGHRHSKTTASAGLSR